MIQSGWRKPTPGLCRANDLAEDGEQLAVPKNQAMLAMRRVAHVIGLKPGDLMLLETLAVFTKPCDWEKGARPIVWPSNDYLVERTGYSLSAVKRHLRRLAEVGLVAFRDSSNGKRWGHRNKEDGRIVEAYGLDLSPLAARAREFEALHAALEAERTLTRDLRRGITILRRTVAALLSSDVDLADALWHDIARRYNALMATLRYVERDLNALREVHQAFLALRGDAEEALRRTSKGSVDNDPDAAGGCENITNLSPTGVNSAPHIQITTHLKHVNCNGIEHATEANGAAEPPMASLKADVAGVAAGKIGSARDRPRVPNELSLQAILIACPAFTAMARGIAGHIRDWRDLLAVADRIRPVIGISEDAWASAHRAMSREAAAVALALITDKYSDGLVSSPGGYLRGLTLKATTGDLHLARSVFGRFRERQGPI